MKRPLQPLRLYLCLMLLLYGCASQDHNKKPQPFIPPQTMQEIMVEYYQLEATLRVCEREKKENVAAYGRQQWESLLRKHRITDEIWKKNYYYYMSQSNLSDTLLAKVSDQLSALEATKAEAMRKELDTQSGLEITMEEHDFGEMILN
jgi:hypothetical protein